MRVCSESCSVGSMNSSSESGDDNAVTNITNGESDDEDMVVAAVGGEMVWESSSTANMVLQGQWSFNDRMNGSPKIATGENEQMAAKVNSNEANAVLLVEKEDEGPLPCGSLRETTAVRASEDNAQKDVKMMTEEKESGMQVSRECFVGLSDDVSMIALPASRSKYDDLIDEKELVEQDVGTSSGNYHENDLNYVVSVDSAAQQCDDKIVAAETVRSQIITASTGGSFVTTATIPNDYVVADPTGIPQAASTVEDEVVFDKRLSSNLLTSTLTENQAIAAAAEQQTAPSFPHFIDSPSAIKPVENNSNDQGIIDLTSSDVDSQENGAQLGGFDSNAAMGSQVMQTSDIGTQADLQVQAFARLDCDKLFDLVIDAMKWGSQVEGNDIILLIGVTGSGKTTSLLHFAGVSFKEIEVNGFLHLQPTRYTSDVLRSCKTGYGADSVTSTLQGFPVKLRNGETVFVCDGPGLNDTRSMEMDIANRIGLMQAIRRAKSVKPVVVIAVDSFGSRFMELLSTLDQISQMTGSLDFSSFSYVFTKAESKRWSSRIPKILSGLRQNLGSEPENPRLASLLDDMVNKTSPFATLIQPLDDDKENSLQKILDNNNVRVECIQSLFRWCLSEATTNVVRVELERLEREVEECFFSEDFMTAGINIKRLARLATLLPEITSSYALRGRDFCIQLGGRLRQQVEDRLRLIDMMRSVCDLQALTDVMTECKKKLAMLSQIAHLEVICDTPSKDCSLLTAELFLPLLDQSVRGISIYDAKSSTTAIECFILNQTTFRWHLTCLFNLKDVLAGYSSGDKANSSHSEALNKLSFLLDAAYTSSMDMFHHQLDLNHLERVVTVFQIVTDDLRTKFYTEEASEDWDSIASRMESVLLKFRAAAVDGKRALLKASQSLKDATEENSACLDDFFVDLRSAELYETRGFFIALAQSDKLCKHLPTDFGDPLQQVRDFDDFLSNYFNATARLMVESVKLFVSSGIENSSFDTRKREAKTMREKLLQTITMCKMFRSIHRAEVDQC